MEGNRRSAPAKMKRSPVSNAYSCDELKLKWGLPFNLPSRNVVPWKSHVFRNEVTASSASCSVTGCERMMLLHSRRMMIERTRFIFFYMLC